MRHLTTLLGTGAFVLCTAQAHADLGDQIVKLLADDGAEFDRFGSAVAISGTTAIVGTWQDDDNGSNSGSAYLFDISDPKNPVQMAKLLADDGGPSDYFGLSVGISGTIAIIGASQEGSPGTAYLFDATTGLQIAKLLADDGGVGDKFGESVAISGTTAIVGAWLHDPGNLGSAYLFDVSDPRNPVQIDGMRRRLQQHPPYGLAFACGTL